MSVTLLSVSDLENVLDQPERAGRVAGLVERERDPETLVIDCGDTLGPSLLGSETDGEAALAVYEHLGVDNCAFGNHDFDHGLDALRDVVTRADPTWLCANLEPHGEDRPLLADAGVERWTVERVAGERVGLFGVTETEILSTSGWDEEFHLGDPLAAAREAVAAIQTAGADRIVAVSHCGPLDERLRAALPLDAVLGGHTHERVAETVDGAATTKPGERGEAVARVELTEPPTAKLLDTEGAPIAPDLRERLRGARADLGLDETVAAASDPIGRQRRDCAPESPIGNLVADAVRRAADTDVAVVDSGGLRAGPPLDGDVTEAELRATTPMDGELYAGPIDGADLRDLFVDAVTDVEGVPEVTLHVSGASLRWERTAEACRLVEATVGGEPLDPERTYRIASGAYTFWAPEFPTLDHEPASPAGRLQEAVVRYARAEGLPTETDGRMVAVSDAFEEGEPLSLS